MGDRPSTQHEPPVCGFEATTASAASPVASPLYPRHRTFSFTPISHPFQQHNLRVTLFIVGKSLRVPFPTLWAASLFFRRQGVHQDSRTVDSCSPRALCGTVAPREGARQTCPGGFTGIPVHHNTPEPSTTATCKCIVAVVPTCTLLNIANSGHALQATLASYISELQPGFDLPRGLRGFDPHS